MKKNVKMSLVALGLLVGLSNFSSGGEVSNLAWWAASEITDSGLIQNGAAGAGGTAGAYAGAWAAAKLGAAVGTTAGPVGTAVGAIVGAGIGAA
ncbi:MAG: hypothetical protein AAF600_18630 [Bacteroidota bacterium]